MKAIKKGQEPRSLTKHRQTPHCDYGNYRSKEKETLRGALVQEQGGLCCYCMSRITARSETMPLSATMKIEHWQCQENYPLRQLDYANLLGACLGGEGMPKAHQHCDTRKGQQDLKFNPAEPAHGIQERIRYDPDGTIASRDEEFNRQLSEVLNLNLERLKNLRKGVVDALAEWLREYRSLHHRGPDNATLERKRAHWMPGSGYHQPFAQVAVWFIDQRLAQAQDAARGKR